LRSRDDSIAGRATTEGGAVSLFLEVCGYSCPGERSHRFWLFYAFCFWVRNPY